MSTLYEFKAPYDRLVKITTYSIIASTAALFTYISYLALMEGGIGILIPPLLAVLYFLMIFLPYLFSPRSYVLTTKGILIKRPLKSILVPYSEVVSIKKVAWASMLRIIRLWGSGGLYGFIGLFRVPDMNRVWMYVTDRGRMLLIETKRNVKYVISPSDPSMFIERLRTLAPWLNIDLKVHRA